MIIDENLLNKVSEQATTADELQLSPVIGGQVPSDA